MRTLLLLLLLPTVTQAQFSCVLSGANDEQSCFQSTDTDTDRPCVWCNFNSLGFCLSETEAAAAKQNIPTVHCDYYNGDTDDDQVVTDDDHVAPTDDVTPSDDDWKCLEANTPKDCNMTQCVWCNSKAGFGLCMGGPSAEAAEDSDWFDCVEGSVVDERDPYDPSCLASFLQDPTEDGCKAAADEDGAPCEWCEMPGVGNLCVNQEQAEMAEQMGVTCDSSGSTPQDPYDPSCLAAYLQDPTENGCKAAADEDGAPCEWCEMPGVGNLCVNQEQAEMAEQMGVTCDAAVKTPPKDPYDPTCLASFLQDPTEDGCKAAADEDGQPCEWCEMPGVGNLCVNQEQAEMAEQMGVTCDSSSAVQKTPPQDPYDPSCLAAYLQDPTEEWLPCGRR